MHAGAVEDGHAHLLQCMLGAVEDGHAHLLQAKWKRAGIFADGYYSSAKMLVRALNDGVKGGSVKFSYDPVTQKVCVHMKGDTTFMFSRRYSRHTRIRDGRRRGHANVSGSLDVDTRLLHRRFEAWFRIAICLFEHRRTTHRRRQDCTAAANSADNRTPRGDGDGSFRPRPVHSRAVSRIRADQCHSNAGR